MLEQVTGYINENVLHSKLWDASSVATQSKAVNQAVGTLMRYLPAVYKGVDAPPVEDVAEQALWLLKMDDSMQRAEMGTLMITVDGTQVQLKDMDRTISPKIMNLYGLESTKRKRVGSYSVSVGHTYRTGN